MYKNNKEYTEAKMKKFFEDLKESEKFIEKFKPMNFKEQLKILKKVRD